MPKAGAKKYYTKKGKEVTNPWHIHVFTFAEKKKISFGEAMRDPDISKGYVKLPAAKK